MTAIESEAGPLIGHLQTDTFCDGCGYNLHTQPVMRDARLGILICRCPECGRFNAAGRTTAASQSWLNRLAIAMLLIWLLFLLLFFGLGTIFLGTLAYGHAAQGTTFAQVPLPGQAPNANAPYLDWQRVIDKANKPAEELTRERQQSIAILVTTGVLSVILGGAFSTFMWHCRGTKRLWVFVMPVIACGFAYLNWTSEWANRHLHEWGLRRILEYGAWECLAIMVGLVLGRPVVRGALSVLLPPKVRQHLAFLWTRDGKRLSIQSES